MKGYLHKEPGADSGQGETLRQNDPFCDPRLAILEDVSRIVGATLDPGKLFYLIIESAAKVMNAEASSLLLLDEEKEKLYFEAATGSRGDEVKKFEIPLGKGISGWVAKTGEPLLVPDVHNDPRWSSSISSAVDFVTTSIACAPMMIDEEVVGVMQIINKTDGLPFDSKDLAMLTAFAKVAASIYEKARSLRTMTIENESLRESLEKWQNIIGESSALKGVMSNALKASKTKTTVLITGESGTGKELMARFLHENSKRNKGPFVVVNCAAIPENLIESELFGHEKGSFTGAHARQIGKFEMASGGTIFLDEIGEMTLPLQVKLLRVLQESQVERVGGGGSVDVDVRIVAATNRDLKEAMEDGTFRKDLYFRLNVVNLHMPPLRERKDDIPLFLDFFINKYNREVNKQFTGISNKALSFMISHEWRGNIRELQNLISRIVTLEEGPMILPEHLPPEMTSEDVKNTIDVGHTMKDAINIFKKEFISKTLKATGGNKTKAARILDIQRSYLSKISKELGVG